MIAEPLCPEHCTPLRSHRTVYGNRWQCPVSGCTVACWEGSTSTPADDVTRQARMEVHKAFDPLWRDRTDLFSVEGECNNRRSRRWRAYGWLAWRMGRTREETHIGHFGMAECDEAMRHVADLKAEQEQPQ